MQASRLISLVHEQADLRKALNLCCQVPGRYSRGLIELILQLLLLIVKILIFICTALTGFCATSIEYRLFTFVIKFYFYRNAVKLCKQTTKAQSILFSQTIFGIGQM